MELSDREAALVYQSLLLIVDMDEQDSFISKHELKRIKVIIARIEEEVV